MPRYHLDQKGNVETLRSIALANGAGVGCCFTYAEFQGLRFLLGIHARLFETQACVDRAGALYPKASVFVRVGADSTCIHGDEDDLSSFYKVQTKAG